MIMRVCPKCGHTDYSQWHENRYRTNVDFLKMENADETNIAPKILEELKERGWATDELYAYRIMNPNKRPCIERVIRAEFDVVGLKAFHIPRERVNHARNPNQKKLLENETKDSLTDR